MDKPNIIFYFSDQQRYDTFNADVMPYLTDLSKTGTVFDNAFTCQPVCGPARACLQTGIYASENGCYKNDISMDINAETIAKLLSGAGYDTAYIGKWHLASNGITQNYMTKPIPEEFRGGYRYWRAADCLEFTSNGYGGFVYNEKGEKIEFDYNRADAINDFAVEYLKNGRAENKPFFMFISQLEPHHQNSTDNYECPKGYGELFKNAEIPGDLKGLKGNYDRCYSDYLGCCRSLDENVERLVSTLKENDLFENTVLIYTSDHGCHFRTRNFEYKRSCHHASTHVPMVAVGREFNTGKNYDGLISLIDVPATLLDIAGVKVPEAFRGVSIADLINGCAERDCVYLEISESQLGRAIITKEYTFSVRKRRSLGLTGAESNSYVEDKLYDNINDVYQHNNLIKNSKYREVRKVLREKLLDEIEAVSGKRPKIVPKLTKLNLNDKIK